MAAGGAGAGCRVIGAVEVVLADCVGVTGSEMGYEPIVIGISIWTLLLQYGTFPAT